MISKVHMIAQLKLDFFSVNKS